MVPGLVEQWLRKLKHDDESSSDHNKQTNIAKCGVYADYMPLPVLPLPPVNTPPPAPGHETLGLRFWIAVAGRRHLIVGGGCVLLLLLFGVFIPKLGHA